jgi:hypothetical protein
VYVQLALSEISRVECLKLRFGKQCSCHLQREHVVDRRFLKSYKVEAVGGEWNMTNPIGGAEWRAPIQLLTSAWYRKRSDENFLESTR